MDYEAFKSSLSGAAPPAGLPPALQALWWQSKGDWHRAHRCCQDEHSEPAAWAHAYLHRVEGDLNNAGGWYRRANKTPSSVPLSAEWEQIARALLAA